MVHHPLFHPPFWKRQRIIIHEDQWINLPTAIPCDNPTRTVLSVRSACSSLLGFLKKCFFYLWVKQGLRLSFKSLSHTSDMNFAITVCFRTFSCCFIRTTMVIWSVIHLCGDFILYVETFNNSHLKAWELPQCKTAILKSIRNYDKFGFGSILSLV